MVSMDKVSNLSTAGMNQPQSLVGVTKKEDAGRIEITEKFDPRVGGEALSKGNLVMASSDAPKMGTEMGIETPVISAAALAQMNNTETTQVPTGKLNQISASVVNGPEED